MVFPSGEGLGGSPTQENIRKISNLLHQELVLLHQVSPYTNVWLLGQ